MLPAEAAGRFDKAFAAGEVVAALGEGGGFREMPGSHIGCKVGKWRDIAWLSCANGKTAAEEQVVLAILEIQREGFGKGPDMLQVVSVDEVTPDEEIHGHAPLRVARAVAG